MSYSWQDLRGLGFMVVPWLVACIISVLHSGDVPLHALHFLPHYNAHGNEAAGDEPVCSELCLSASDLLRL